ALLSISSGAAASSRKPATFGGTASSGAPTAAGEPGASGEVLVAGLHRLGVARLDGEGHWLPANDGLRASLLTWLAPSPRFGDDRTVFGLSLDEGLLVSRDGGQGWTRAWPDDADPSIAALAVATGPTNGSTLLASTLEQVYRSADGGTSWEALPADAAPP